MFLLFFLFVKKQKAFPKSVVEANNFVWELVLSPIFGMNKQEKVGVGVNADFV